jgi:hypothetical protein
MVNLKPHIPPSSLDGFKSSKSLVRRLVICAISWHIIDMSLEWHFGWHKLSKSSANDNLIESKCDPKRFEW